MAGKRDRISEDKAKRIALGATVAGVLLIVFLIVILIIQFVQIGVRRSELAKLKEEIAQYEQMNELSRADLEWYRNGLGLYLTARKYGWT